MFIPFWNLLSERIVMLFFLLHLVALFLYSSTISACKLSYRTNRVLVTISSKVRTIVLVRFIHAAYKRNLIAVSINIQNGRNTC
ncbi:hypothetical protein GDO78_011711 [Eleutherodactylus coqui]|uniref:Uncharacterized protein n=1 Tax=Eleutherodactylus coqui TaxID=57060 RepID=A0A8J6F1L3_ELECQ|nr:hypothetical protein GDO78_011711 [Eleutherodactylus coqui]